ncbi:MAG: hypothetical protein ACHWZW_06485 [Spirulina sp.]
MNAQLMIQPSAFIDADIQMKMVRGLYLFKFSEPLQERLESLNEKQRISGLNPDEEAELTGILALDRIFTLLNAKVISEAAEKLRAGWLRLQVNGGQCPTDRLGVRPESSSRYSIELPCRCGVLSWKNC